MPRGKSGVQRAAYERKSVDLSNEWAATTAREKFGAEIVARFPTFSKGPRKGLPKGYLCWVKCTEGGWTYEDTGNGRGGGVLKPGSHFWRLTLIHPDLDREGRTVIARWTWAKPDPVVEILQDPTALALELKKPSAWRSF